MPYVQPINEGRIQCRLWEFLSDGLPHTYKELIPLLEDSEATKDNLQPHISILRRRLPPGQEIICIHLKRQLGYRRIVAFDPLKG